MQWSAVADDAAAVTAMAPILCTARTRELLHHGGGARAVQLEVWLKWARGMCSTGWRSRVRTLRVGEKAFLSLPLEGTLGFTHGAAASPPWFADALRPAGPYWAARASTEAALKAPFSQGHKESS